ncbi:DUF4190 domain-containing protein [Streptomyces sp. CB01881]|uniref:DUF4190 domain-containing protein n=1 Tax=Streptomyces sp. CB01881 TaxID=2078691 RepID=UPI001F11E8F6|nr:DUF4190 domain-containing protein [Streptomyces sp. CB01881]
MSTATSTSAVTSIDARTAVDAGTGTTRRHTTSEADNLAVASFLLGLPGLLLFNIVLGPLAIVLATLALVRGTRRRGRAVLGLVLGVAALALLAVTTAADHGVLWQLGT